MALTFDHIDEEIMPYGALIILVDVNQDNLI
jgi:hypothetical protein